MPPSNNGEVGSSRRKIWQSGPAHTVGAQAKMSPATRNLQSISDEDKRPTTDHDLTVRGTAKYIVFFF